ncbi:MAG: hypothetical protein H6739_20440 [Alphaproteobacteria bacterium]|nr:hypothetical protein [Alphaproteobacteria bacterium]
MHERRERELVLAPNEYAYVLDTTKGHINCYVGPNKTSLAQTDQPVIFNAETRRFEHVELSFAVQLFATAPANGYLVLMNPAADNVHPKLGIANSLIDLQIGRKIIVPGPASFPLWPGQTAQVIPGHRLRSNEYLYVQVYDADEAARHWKTALGLDGEAAEAPAGEQPRTFVVGEKHLIKGTDVKFYIPPSGVEVIPDGDGRYVRRAVTLQRLQYCVLVGEDGRKETIRGEAVVFPGPNQVVLERDGRSAFPAFELSDTTGLHIKVVAPYADADGAERREGEELFITGDGVVYFPRQEHAIVPHAGGELHRAVAIPKGEGCYVLDRATGERSLVRGPRMFLPDPRRQVIVQRVLSDREVHNFYPGNHDALTWNRQLRLQRGVVGVPAQLHRNHMQLERFAGAVRVDVWSGYAVEVVDKSGNRRVVTGPTSILLAYDETLQHLRLSTGRPKSSENLLETVFLKVAGNKVSDCVDFMTRDLVRARLTLHYRVNFEGDEPGRWFAVDDYIKLLCEHARSMIKARLRQLSIREVQADITPQVRDLLLGAKPEEGPRPGRSFAENSMRVYDVEVLELEITDRDVAELLTTAQAEAIEQAVEVAARETQMARELRVEEIERAVAQEKHQTELLRLQLAAERAERQQLEAEANKVRRAKLDELDATLRRAATALEVELRARKLEADAAETQVELTRRRALQEMELRTLEARVDGAVKTANAFDPKLAYAVQRLGDQELLTKLAANFGELAAVEGRGLLETARRYLDFMPAGVVPTLRAETPEAK